jgi:hypothetical protein
VPDYADQCSWDYADRHITTAFGEWPGAMVRHVPGAAMSDCLRIAA